MIVLTGAQGVSEMLAQALSQGVSGLKLARGLLGAGSGSTEAEAEVAALEVPSAAAKPLRRGQSAS